MRVRHRFIIFCFVGGIAAILDMLFFNLFFSILKSGFIVSRILGIGISMIWNFTMNKYVTFSSKEGNIKKQLAKYLFIYSITMGLNVISGIVVLRLIGESVIGGNIAAVAGIVISVPLNFLFSLFWTFKKP